MKLEKRRSFYPVKKAPYRTMLPCPYCLTFHSVGEYAKVKMEWHGEVIKQYMNVYEIAYDTGCPMCGATFQIRSHEKMVGEQQKWRLVYFSIPKNPSEPLDN